MDHIEQNCSMNVFFRRFPNNQVPQPIPVFPPFELQVFDKIDRAMYKDRSPKFDLYSRLEGLITPKILGNKARVSRQSVGTTVHLAISWNPHYHPSLVSTGLITIAVQLAHPVYCMS